MNITVPTSLSDITWGDYLKYKSVMEADGLNKNIEMLALVSIFCHITVQDAENIASKDLQAAAIQINQVLSLRPVFTQRFEMDGIDFGMVPNLDDMTAGEYIDLDKYFHDDETKHLAMAVLYRPIIKKKRWRNWLSKEKEPIEVYTIEKYQGSSKYSEQMMNASLDVVKGCEVFFYNLGSDLLKATRDYLQQPKVMENLAKADSSVSGDGIKASLQSLEQMSLILKRPQSLISTRSLLFSNSRPTSRKKKAAKSNL